MAVDKYGMSHKPAGLPQGVAGTYDHKQGFASDVDIEPTADQLAALEMDGWVDYSQGFSYDETKALLQQASRITVGPEGVTLFDQGGHPLTNPGMAAMLDRKAVLENPEARQAVRDVLRGDLTGLDEHERKEAMHQAWRFASPYDRRRAIDESANVRYIPPSSLANSLRRRKDRDGAVARLIDIHYMDATVSADIIRSGFPDDKDSAFRFINATKFERQKVGSKQYFDGDGNPVTLKAGHWYDHEGNMLPNINKFTDRKGNDVYVNGNYLTDKKGKRLTVSGQYVDKDGKLHNGVKPAQTGAVARSYLRMLYQPTKGVMSESDARHVANALHAIGEASGPEAQAQAFYQMCYGEGSVTNPDGNVDWAVRTLQASPRQVRNVNTLRHASGDPSQLGQGNNARMVAYQQTMSREAVLHFLTMDPADNRTAHTGFTKRKRNAQGKMETVKPKRLTEMRSYLRSVYRIGRDEENIFRHEHGLPLVGVQAQPANSDA